MLRTDTNGLKLRIAALFGRTSSQWLAERPESTTLTAIADLPFTIVARLEELERDYREDTTGFWNMLNWVNGTRHN